RSAGRIEGGGAGRDFRRRVRWVSRAVWDGPGMEGCLTPYASYGTVTTSSETQVWLGRGRSLDRSPSPAGTNPPEPVLPFRRLRSPEDGLAEGNPPQAPRPSPRPRPVRRGGTCRCSASAYALVRRYRSVRWAA